MIPRLLLMPFAGAWADRHDRKRTMMAMDFANGLVSGLLALLVINKRLNLPLPARLDGVAYRLRRLSQFGL